MQAEQYSNTKDTINAVHSRLQSVYRSFAGAQVRVAMVSGTMGPRFLTGIMVFAEQKVNDRTVADYRQVRLAEFWIDGQDNAVNFLSRLLAGQESVSGIPVPNTFNHSNANHDAGGHRASGWPSWLYTTSADSRNGEQRLFLEQQPTVNNGLAPFRSPADAVRCWVFQEPRCDAMTNDVPFQEQFLVVIPDTRARFISGRWSPGKLELALEINTPLRDLELQILHVGSENRSANYPVLTEPMVLQIPEDAQELVLYIVHKSGDLVCMHSLNSVYRSFGRFESPDTEGVDYAQDLQRGENEVREFKSFVTPMDKKEFELVKSAVAFANTDGGTLFVGVDDEGVPLGITAARKCFKAGDPIEAQRTRLKSLITANTKPVPSVVYTIVNVNENPVVVAEVKKSPTICSTHDNRVYVRRGATSRLADPQTELPSLIKSPGPGIGFEF